MAARKKTVSRRFAAKKAAKVRKVRRAAKKAAKTRKGKVAAKKAVRPRKVSKAAKKTQKAATPRRTNAAAPGVTRRVAAVAPNAPVVAPISAPLSDIDQRIAIVRANLRELVEQAASSAGAASEELMSQRISQQEEKLRMLTAERDELARRGG